MLNQEAFNIVDYFREAASQNPGKIAIVEGEKSISYGELRRQVEETAQYFREKGIQKGDRVLVFVPMSVDLYRSVLALFHLGATAVFLDEWVSKSRMEVCCQVAGCKAFIGIPKARILSFFSRELRKIPVKLGHRYKEAKQKHTLIPCFREDVALITFTTGSTGIPKAAKRTHGFLDEQFKALKDKIQPTVNDVDLTILPIVLLINLGVGCTSVISNFKPKKPQSLDCAKLLSLLLRHRVSCIIASPYFVKQVALYLKQQPTALPGLKQIYTGGAPVFVSDAETIMQGFTTAKLEIVYGSTEAEPISSVSGEELLADTNNLSGLLVGTPCKQATVKIIRISDEAISCTSDSELEKLSLPAGEIGEIIVSGDHVLREYLNNPEALKRNKIFIGDTCWHRTGDSGFLDAGGQLYLCGRCSSLIDLPETRIAPFVYENLIQSLPEIELGTIIHHHGKLILAAELKAGFKTTSLESLTQQLREKGLKFDTLQLLAQIPRDPRHHSKIDYERLTSLLSL